MMSLAYSKKVTAKPPRLIDSVIGGLLANDLAIVSTTAEGALTICTTIIIVSSGNLKSIVHNQKSYIVVYVSKGCRMTSIAITIGSELLEVSKPYT